jgi:hypothetical protein
MLEEKIVIKKEESKEYPPVPEDIYQVELLDITSKWQDKYKAEGKELKFSFQFTILAGKDKQGESLRGRNIWRNFVPTYLYEGKNGKNLLYQILEAILGHELTPEEEAKLDSDFLNSLIGKQCRVLIKNKITDKATYSNIENLLKANEQLDPLTEEEKEVARVKVKDAESVREEHEEDSVDISDIPF